MFKSLNRHTETNRIQGGSIWAIKTSGVCFIINVQCTLDNCAVSFFSRSTAVLLQHHLRGDPHPSWGWERFYPSGKTENEECLAKIQRGEQKGCKTAHGLLLFLCRSDTASPQRRISLKLKMRETQIEDERDFTLWASTEKEEQRVKI